jgi:hypothetical protein
MINAKRVFAADAAIDAELLRQLREIERALEARRKKGTRFLSWSEDQTAQLRKEYDRILRRIIIFRRWSEAPVAEKKPSPMISSEISRRLTDELRLTSDLALARILLSIRFPPPAKCPCGGQLIHNTTYKTVRCATCGRQKNVAAGTIFEKSHEALRQWLLIAINLLSNPDIATVQLSAAINGKRLGTVRRLAQKIKTRTNFAKSVCAERLTLVDLLQILVGEPAARQASRDREIVSKTAAGDSAPKIAANEKGALL